MTANPAMFRSNPIGFICSVILIAAFGLGLVILFVWWLKCKTRTITITNKRTTVREGLISKNTSEILHSHIRNIQVIQGVLDRIFGVGTLAISSAAQSDMESADLRQSRRLEFVNRSKRINCEPPKGGYSSNMFS